MSQFKKIYFEGIENKEWYTRLIRIRILGIILLFFIPIFILIDLLVCFNNYILFPLANIDRLKRSKYIKISSRLQMPHKSLWYRIGCVYCAYVNGVSYFMRDLCMSYEMLFCPWKNKGSEKVKHYKEFKDW